MSGNWGYSEMKELSRTTSFIKQIAVNGCVMRLLLHKSPGVSQFKSSGLFCHSSIQLVFIVYIVYACYTVYCMQ